MSPPKVSEIRQRVADAKNSSEREVDIERYMLDVETLLLHYDRMRARLHTAVQCGLRGVFTEDQKADIADGAVAQYD